MLMQALEVSDGQEFLLIHPYNIGIIDIKSLEELCSSEMRKLLLPLYKIRVT